MRTKTQARTTTYTQTTTKLKDCCGSEVIRTLTTLPTKNASSKDIAIAGVFYSSTLLMIDLIETIHSGKENSVTIFLSPLYLSMIYVLEKHLEARNRTQIPNYATSLCNSLLMAVTSYRLSSEGKSLSYHAALLGTIINATMALNQNGVGNTFSQAKKAFFTFKDKCSDLWSGCPSFFSRSAAPKAQQPRRSQPSTIPQFSAVRSIVAPGSMIVKSPKTFSWLNILLAKDWKVYAKPYIDILNDQRYSNLNDASRVRLILSTLGNNPHAVELSRQIETLPNKHINNIYNLLSGYQAGQQDIPFESCRRSLVNIIIYSQQRQEIEATPQAVYTPH